MKMKALSRWAMFAIVIAILSELFSSRFEPSPNLYILLRYVLPIGFSVVGLSLLLLVGFREWKGR
jgi:hypothetical protein